MVEYKPDMSRKPKPLYKDTNGFTEVPRARVQGTTRLPNLHLPVTSLEETLAVEHKRNINDAVERRRLAEDVLSLTGSYFPGCVSASAPSCTQASLNVREP